MASLMMTNNLHGLLECGICLEHMTNPKILDCLHSFCKDCLLKWWQERSINGYVCCPTCRMRTFPEKGRFSEIKNDLLQNKLADILKQPQVALCEVCPGSWEEEGTPKPIKAKWLCKICHDYMCEKCADSHKGIPSFTSHLLVPVPMENKPNKGFCSKHPLKCQDYYCEACDVLLCSLCATAEHKHHGQSVHDATDYVSGYAKKMDALVVQLEKIYDLQDFAQFGDTLHNLEKVHDGITELKNEVTKHADLVIAVLIRQKNELHETIEESRSVLKGWDEWAAGTKCLKPHVQKLLQRFHGYSKSSSAHKSVGLQELFTEVNKGATQYGEDIPSLDVLRVPVRFVPEYPVFSIGKVVKQDVGNSRSEKSASDSECNTSSTNSCKSSHIQKSIQDVINEVEDGNRLE